MHKRRFNEIVLEFKITPQGPLLIKSSSEGGADPRLVDMNFVRTYYSLLGRDTVYLPGSSLKGTIRSYAEKVGRTLAPDGSTQPPLSCNPLGDDRDPASDDYACGAYLEKQKNLSAKEKHARSCPICRTFGNTAIASHARFSDAYPLRPGDAEQNQMTVTNMTEERDGVAIDRVSGAVAVGPFNFEVVTRGAFYASLQLHNFQLWQLGLLAIVLRDFSRGRIPIGFAKSRGLGRVAVTFERLELSYPGQFELTDDLRRLRSVADFLSEDEVQAYDYRPEQALEPALAAEVAEAGDFGRVALIWQSHAAIEQVLRQSVPYWADLAQSWGN